MTAACRTDRRGRPLERVLLSALLAALVSPWLLLLTAIVGLNQWLFVLAGASLILARVLGLRATA